MDITINKIIDQLQEAEKKLIECYQADSIGQTSEAVKLAMEINQRLIDSGLAFANVAMELVEKDTKSRAKLTIVK